MAKIHTDDIDVLRYAGMMGHEYVGTCDQQPEPEIGRGTRRCFVEAISKESAIKHSAGYKNVRVYKRSKNGWVDVT